MVVLGGGKTKPLRLLLARHPGRVHQARLHLVARVVQAQVVQAQVVQAVQAVQRERRGPVVVRLAVRLVVHPAALAPVAQPPLK